MKIKEYEQFVAERAKQPIDDIGYNAIGLCGEAGEVAEWVKKSHYRGNKAFTDEMLLLELGDVQHYLTRITIQKGWSLKDIMKANMKKLKERS